MKKILVILVLWCGFAQGQTPPGYTLINSRYDWLAGIFKGLGLPSGGTPAFSAGQAVRDGAVFCDTVESAGSPRGLYIYTDGSWILQGLPTNSVLPNALLAGGSVTYSGTGLLFSVEAAVYRIDNQIYSSDSGSFTLPASDPDFDRFSRVYLATDNAFHVLNGTPAIPAIIPQVNGDELPLTEILVRAAATAPDITQTIIYDENTESIVSNTGTTTDPNNATNVYQGAKSVNVTNINHGDAINFDTDGSPLTWSLTNVDALSIHIRLKIQMPTLASLRVSFWNGTSQVSSEVIVGMNKNNATTYQAISIPMSAFGTITNYNITRVRFRYINTGGAANYTGFYLDYMFLVDGIVLGGNGAVNQVSLAMPSGFTVTGSPGTGNVFLSVTGAGNSTQYINGLGALTSFPTLLNQVGTFGGRAPTANGAVIDGDSIYFWPVDYDFPGLPTPAMKMKWDSSYFIQNRGNGDTLAIPINDSVTGIKSLVAGTGVTLTPTDTTIVIESSGGGGRFGVSGEDATAAQNRDFDASTFNFFNHGTTGYNRILRAVSGGGDPSTEIYQSADSLFLFSNINGSQAYIGVTNDALAPTINILAPNDMNLQAGYLGAGFGNAYIISSQDYHVTGENLKLTGNDSINLIHPNFVTVADSANYYMAVTSKATGKLGKAYWGSGGGGGGGAWGTITGTLSSQTDLQTALDAKLAHTTASPAHTGTTPSGAGVMPATMFIRPTSDFTLANSTSDQTAFGSALDVWTLQASTSYYFEGEYYITHGAVSHALSMGFTLAGGASVTSINYSTQLMTGNVNTVATAQSTVYITQTASTAINLAGANGIEYVKFSGWMNVNAGGTFTPIIKFSVDPTGTCLMKAGSYIMFTPMGANTIESIGNVN